MKTVLLVSLLFIVSSSADARNCIAVQRKAASTCANALSLSEYQQEFVFSDSEGYQALAERSSRIYEKITERTNACAKAVELCVKECKLVLTAAEALPQEDPAARGAYHSCHQGHIFNMQISLIELQNNVNRVKLQALENSMLTQSGRMPAAVEEQ